MDKTIPGKQLNGKTGMTATSAGIAIFLVSCGIGFSDTVSGGEPMLLGHTLLKGYVDRFNAGDTEHYRNTYSNKDAYAFLAANVPLFECPDKAIEKIYTKSHAFRDIPPGSDQTREAVVKEDLPWIDENLDPYTGNWLARTRLNRGVEDGAQISAAPPPTPRPAAP